MQIWQIVILHSLQSRYIEERLPPPDRVVPGEFIPSYFIQPQLYRTEQRRFPDGRVEIVQQVLDVHISYVVNPGLFFFFVDSESYDDLEDLLDQMEYVFRSPSPLCLPSAPITHHSNNPSSSPQPLSYVCTSFWKELVNEKELNETEASYHGCPTKAHAQRILIFKAHAHSSKNSFTDGVVL